MAAKVNNAPLWASKWEIIGNPTEQNNSESLLGGVVRQGARTLARAGETALGLPGDVANLALSGANLAQRPLTGKNSETIERIQKSNPFTSQNIREKWTGGLEKKLLPEGYLEPQGDYEKLADSFVSDLTSILMPIGGAVGLAAKGGKIAKGALKSAAITSGLGNATGFLTKKITGSEKAGDFVKMGTMLGTAFVGVPGMKQVASKGYDAVQNMIPETLNVSTQPLNDAIREAEKLIIPHASTRGGKALNDYFKDTLSKVAEIPEEKLKNIIEVEKGFNKVISQNPSIAQDTKKAMDLVKRAIDNTIQQAGRPDIYNAHKSARKLYSEAFRAQEAQDWVKDVAHSVPNKIGKIKATTKFLLGIPGKAHGLIDEGIRLFKIPEVRRYWGQAINASFQRSRPAWIKAVHMLDKATDKHKPPTKNWESRWEIVG